jgi:hypothetical protein
MTKREAKQMQNKAFAGVRNKSCASALLLGSMGSILNFKLKPFPVARKVVQ